MFCVNCGAEVDKKEAFCKNCGSKIVDNSGKAVKKEIISQDDMMNLLETCYQKSQNGIPKVSPPVEVMASDYLVKSEKPEEAAKKMLRNQVAKCATSGFITGFGGAITMPVTIPANIGSVLYVQMRMIACTAYMAGFDLKSDQVQTFVYACLAGVSVNELVKKAGIKLGEKLATSMVKKIPGKALTKINQKVGFRLVTKFGQKGIVNLGKMIPGVGAVIGGTLDYAETKVIANRAYKMFFEGDFGEDEDGDGYIDVDVTEDNIIDDITEESNN